MKTDIEYLTLLEQDLEKAAARETRVLVGRSPRHVGGRRPRRWPTRTAAAAAFLVVAFAIGSLLQGGNGFLSQDDKFDEVGAAVDAGGGGDTAFDPDERYVADAEGQPAAQPTPAPEAPGAERDTPPVGQDLSKIVRDGQISVEIDNDTFPGAFGDVIVIAEGAGGMVLSSTTEGGTAGTLVLRIPSAEFDRVLVAVGRLGTVTSSATKGADVTAEYIDLQARLKILKTKRAFYFELFENATTVAQSIQMENRLEDVQLEIEQLQGRIRYLDDQVALSTLRVSLREKNAPEPEEQTDISNPSLARALDLAWQGTLRVLSTVVVGLGYLVPIAIVAGLVAAVLMLVRRRGRGAS